jgi:hypothetical protein
VDVVGFGAGGCRAAETCQSNESAAVYSFDGTDHSSQTLGAINATMQSDELNYHHLRLFWEAARSGSLRAAAERLHLSQPTLSAQIKALEESLGEKLFERAGRGLKLTARGSWIAQVRFLRSAAR